ncbi:MAG: sigma-70 family RNA polymerase sigma factor [Gemmatimonadetes bacterium]|nr:sigma-70 family RNA polymerase sigma factor [Gemmatimonadota bacterium]
MTGLSLTAEDRRHAFEVEALPHLDSIHRVALRLTRDATDAEDLTQDTMLKAFRSFHLYRPGSNIRAWLFTILRHTFFTQYRRRQRRPDVDDAEMVDDFSLYRAVQEVDPEGRFFEQIVDDTVLRAIDDLPDEFRETLVLSDVEGLRYDEIAEITAAPVGTVKSRLFRARKALQRRLYDYAVEMGYIKRKVE